MTGEEQKPSAEIKDGRIEYSFKCGIIAWQEELTLGQDELLAGLIGRVAISDTDEIKLSDLIGLLVKDKLLSKFLNIILLQEENKETDYSLLKNSELRAVVSDFFILNPAVRSILQTLDTALTSSQMNPTTSGTEQS